VTETLARLRGDTLSGVIAGHFMSSARGEGRAARAGAAT
jgi:hypothetical protein